MVNCGQHFHREPSYFIFNILFIVETRILTFYLTEKNISICHSFNTISIGIVVGRRRYVTVKGGLLLYSYSLYGRILCLLRAINNK